MTLVTIIVAGLATWQIVEIWHHGLIFASWRARVELWEGFFGDLLMCPWCLSVWVGGLCTAWLMLASALGYGVLAWPLYAFAASRLANVCNDATHSFSRTPKPDLTVVVEPEAEDETSKVDFGTEHDE